MLTFRHMILCREIPRIFGRIMLDPGLLIPCPGGDDILRFHRDVVGANGSSLDTETEFILKNIDALPEIQREFEYIFFLLADELYLRDLPVFFHEKWDSRLKIDDLINVGWSVYAFSEPAILHGHYPIKISEVGIVLDDDIINDFGLIKNNSMAERVATLNNKANDENSGYWRVVGLFVDQTTYQRLNSCLSKNKCEK